LRQNRHVAQYPYGNFAVGVFHMSDLKTLSFLSYGSLDSVVFAILDPSCQDWDRVPGSQSLFWILFEFLKPFKVQAFLLHDPEVTDSQEAQQVEFCSDFTFLVRHEPPSGAGYEINYVIAQQQVVFQIQLDPSDGGVNSCLFLLARLQE